MAVLAAILPVVSRSTALALELYRLAASEPEATRDLTRTAKSISNFAVILKQIGTIFQEDDRLPSPEAIETLEDIVGQCTSVLNEIESILPHQDGRNTEEHGDNYRDRLFGSTLVARLNYLMAHLDSLRATLSVMLQTLFTAQSIMWARVRPSISPQQSAKAVGNEKNQLEMLVIEQQMSILSASKLYKPTRPDARLLMEKDSSQSLVPVEHGALQPVHLFKYQDKAYASLDVYDSYEEDWLPSVSRVSKGQLDSLLERWTQLRRFEETLRDAERKAEAKKRENQQPSVDTDSEDEVGALPKFAGSGVRLGTPTPRPPGGIQPLFTETTALPIPFRDSKYGPTAPLSPASSYGVSPRSSGSLFIPTQPGSSPVSPRSSITTLPVEAAAAVEAKDRDDDVDLEIPWTLCTRRHYWKYIDGKVQDSNTDAPTSEAFSDRHSWTEILASWVCKEAMQEAGYKYTQVQKERRDGRRTKFETCFCIEQPLTFDQVHRLVERTVEIYRQRRAPSPRPREVSRRFSNDRQSSTSSASSAHDRERTPKATHHPPLERSTTSCPVPPPPPLDRSLSMPGAVPTYPPNPRATNPHLPLSQSGSPQAVSHSPQAPSHSPLALTYPLQPGAQAMPYHPQAAHYSPQPGGTQTSPYTPQSASFSPQTPLYPSPQNLYPPGAAPPPSNPAYGLQPGTIPQSPLRQSYTQWESRSQPGSHLDHLSSSTTSDSDSAARARKHRSRSRRRSDSTHHKKKHGHSGATGALVGIAGLTALLDGLVGI